MKFLSFKQTKILGSSLALPANGLGESRATSLLVAHFALQNTKFGSEKEKVQNPACIPPQTPPALGKSAEEKIQGSFLGLLYLPPLRLIFRTVNHKLHPFCHIFFLNKNVGVRVLKDTIYFVSKSLSHKGNLLEIK